MELDRETLKALSSDTRADIIKALTKRRYLPSELSRKLGLSPSTVVEHLQVLERVGLVRKEATGHKWIYYALTDKADEIMKPTIPIRILFSVVLGAGLILFSFTQLYTFGVINQATPLVDSLEMRTGGLGVGLGSRIIVTEKGSSLFGISDSHLTEGNLDTIASVPGVKETVPQLYHTDPDAKWTAIGIPPEKSNAFRSNVPIEKGRDLSSADKNVIVAGNGFADKFSLKVGDSFEVAGQKMEIVGIISESGIQDIDNHFILPLDTLKKLAGKETVPVVQVIPEDPSDAQALIERIEKAGNMEAVITTEAGVVIQEVGSIAVAAMDV